MKPGRAVTCEPGLSLCVPQSTNSAEPAGSIVGYGLGMGDRSTVYYEYSSLESPYRLHRLHASTNPFVPHANSRTKRCNNVIIRVYSREPPIAERRHVGASILAEPRRVLCEETTARALSGLWLP